MNIDHFPASSDSFHLLITRPDHYRVQNAGPQIWIQIPNHITFDILLGFLKDFIYKKKLILTKEALIRLFLFIAVLTVWYSFYALQLYIKTSHDLPVFRSSHRGLSPLLTSAFCLNWCPVIVSIRQQVFHTLSLAVISLLITFQV